MTQIVSFLSLHSLDEDVKYYIGVSHYWINTTNITSIGNATYDDFARGYLPELIPVEIPASQEETIYYEMEVSSANCKFWSPFMEDYISDGLVF